MRAEFLSEELKGRDNLDRGGRRKSNITESLKEMHCGMGLVGVIRLRIAANCEQPNEPWSPVNGGEFIVT
jgi:hypothetical protein